MELERLALPPPSPQTLPLQLLQLGCSGSFQLLPGSPGEWPDHPHSRQTLPQGLPPFAPSLLQQLEELFLGSPEVLTPPQNRRLWHRLPLPESLFALEPSPVRGGLRAQRDPHSGALRGLTEELLTPGGLQAEPSLCFGSKDTPCPTRQQPPLPCEEDIDFEGELLTTPPGMKRGVQFNPPAQGGSLSLSSLLQSLEPFELGGSSQEPLEKGGDGERSQPPQTLEEGSKRTSHTPPRPLARADSLEELLHKEEESPPPAPPGQQQQEEEEEEEDEGPWAVEEDAETPVEDFEKRVPDPAIKWPFRPDPFQQRAVLALEQGQSLLVAAHTSAGKTAVAEYAVALAQRHLTRSIYTSPVKALSNQKFRELRATFGDVGLLTGDLQLRPTASCLVMTTEILRSMLFNGSELLQDLEWVIFDEVHYINDPERGVVWEEALILLPPHVKLVLLSATIPNALEFAQWVGRTRHRCLRVLSTRKRPVPLRPLLFVGGVPPGQPRFFPLLCPDGSLDTRRYWAAVEAKKEQMKRQGGGFGAKQPHSGTQGQERGLWRELLGELRGGGLLPAVAFAFSRGGCEELAAALGGQQLLSGGQQGQVRGLLNRCLSLLRGSDRRLPQVLWLSELLQRGIGVHHGGILPLLKEIVEMLFSQGLVQVLFATETFALGVNMPARTVIFDSLHKHDGTNFRPLLPSEFIQMAGRAGRRGLDSAGSIVLLCRGTPPDLSDLHRLLLGRPPPLQSRFRLTFGSVLALLRGGGPGVQALLSRSFGEFPAQRLRPAQQRRVRELRQALAELGGVEGLPPDLPQYHQSVLALRQARAHLMRLVAQSTGARRVLAPGRVLVVSRPPRHRNSPGVIVKVSSEGPVRTFWTLILAERPPELGGPPLPETPPRDAPDPEELLLQRIFLPEGPLGHCLEQLHPEDLGGVSAKTLRLDPEKLLQELKAPPGPPGRPPPPPGPLVSALLQELVRLVGTGSAGGGSLPLLDPLGGGLGLRDPESIEVATKVRELATSLGGFPCTRNPRFPQLYSQFAARQQLLEELEGLQFKLSEQSLQLLPDYERSLKVLRSLGYISEGGSVALGGRVAASLSPPELVGTEVLLGNLVAPLKPEEAAALLVPLVDTGKGGTKRPEVPPNLPLPLREALSQLQGVVERVGVLLHQFELGPPPEEFVAQFSFQLVPVIYDWARGLPLLELVGRGGLQEGALVRVAQRLDELCRGLGRASRLLGDPALGHRLEAAAAAIKRDLVATASLYIQ